MEGGGSGETQHSSLFVGDSETNKIAILYIVLMSSVA